MADRVVLLFTKPARPGAVKTRLIGALSAADAARLHAAFVDDLLARLAGGPFDLRVAWALSPDDELPVGNLPVMRQSGPDLGSRLHRGLGAVARPGRSVAAIGSDHPELGPEHLEQAFAVLESGGADVALGPATDGGYYLIAVRSAALSEHLFRDIPWSTGAVLGTTLERCREIGVRAELLEALSDVDRPEDLDGLWQRLEAGELDCPRTRALMRSWTTSGRAVQACES